MNLFRKIIQKLKPILGGIYSVNSTLLSTSKWSVPETLTQDEFLQFVPKYHKYFDMKKKAYVPRSISDIVKKSNYLANSRFDEARDRGTAFHDAICEYWNTGKAGTSLKFQQWIDSFLSYPNLKNWEPMAVEFPVIDRRFNVAGTLDLLLKHKENGRIVLCDYKTKNEKYSKANHRPQLGGYLSLLWQQYPQIPIDSCRIYWVSPKETKTDDYDPTDCLTSYEAARSVYFDRQLPF